MFGAHMSIAGGLTNALDAAEASKSECVQIFTRNQRQWKAKPIEAEEAAAWSSRLADLGWDDGVARVVTHNSYLVNLASANDETRDKSIAAQRAELERCEALAVPLCVAHPGAHLGTAPGRGKPLDLDAPLSADEEAGIDRIVAGLDAIHADLGGYRVVTCLEATAGTGSNLGYAFHHLATIRDRVRDPERIGFCIDTCHITAAGYDLSTDHKAEQVIGQLIEVLGAEQVRVWHLNDSIGACGSRTDRHAAIGEGECGTSCFRAIVNHPVFADVPKILETPKGEDEKGRDLDVVNLQRLKRLIRRP